MKLGTVALFFALLLIGESVGFPLAVAAETCESHGITYNCMTQDVISQRVVAGYDNGYGGATNATDIQSPAADWPTSFAPGVDVPGGVHVSGTIEKLAYVLAPNGTSASMTTNDTPRWIDFSGLQTVTTGAVHVLQYSFELNQSQLMNGASELYFRAAAQWNSNYTAHYLDVVQLDTEGHEKRLVAAARHTDSPVSTDANDSLVVNDRVYYHLSGFFTTGTIYTVNEYVTTRGTPALALPELPVYIDEGQDVAGDGLHKTRVFPGHENAERDYGYSANATAPFFEVGWSARFFVGISPAGGDLLLANASIDTTELHYYNVRADPHFTSGSQDANLVHIVIPLDTTIHLYNSTVTIVPFKSFTDREANTAAGTAVTLTVPDATDSLVVDVALNVSSWSGANATDHWYDITVDLRLPHSTCPESAGAECSAVTFPTKPQTLPNGNPNWHTQELHGHAFVTTHVVYSQPWISIHEDHTTSPVNLDMSSSSDSNRANFGALLAGILILAGTAAVAALIVVTAPVSVPLLLVVGAATLVAGVGTLAGVCTLRAGQLGMDWTSCLNKDVLQQVLDGSARLVTPLACLSTFLPGIGLGARVALGATCIAGGVVLGCEDTTGQSFVQCLKDLLNLVGDVLKIIVKAVELVAQFVSIILSHFETVLFWVFIILLGFGAPWLLKIGILTILWLAWVFIPGYRKPTDWPPFNRVFHWYVPITSDLIERRLFQWKVEP